MKKTLLIIPILLIVLLLTSCFGSPCGDDYAVKVVFSDTRNEYIDNDGKNRVKDFDGTYYIKDAEDSYKNDPGCYNVYSDKSCKTLVDWQLVIYANKNNQIYIDAYSSTKESTNGDWCGEPSTNFDGQIKTIDDDYAEWTLTPSSLPCITLAANTTTYEFKEYHYQGTISVYVNQPVVLTVYLPKEK